MTLRYSIADLIDRLAISNLKHWHLEEEIGILTKKFADFGESSLTDIEVEQLASMSKASVSMNQYRNKIINAINDFFSDQGLRENRDK